MLNFSHLFSLLHITLNTRWKPKPLEYVLKAETYEIQTEVMQLGWDLISDDLVGRKRRKEGEREWTCVHKQEKEKYEENDEG